ncbi:toxin co-regulated pilus biosynthesis Q family protein [Burkholderia lata]|uniref:toxin co-regulated pilus biosynthesis Q family protein n=1 Tax=Burkholderia lata (strain ATCC 17760 / DSM 23089 / LMG 22485 / NCIMB 9086 / R18194 / 383) TaxID=482957 RepID=UPI0015835A0E
MRIRVAVLALGGLLLTGLSGSAIAADGTPTPVGGGWQPLSGGGQPSVERGSSAGAPAAASTESASGAVAEPVSTKALEQAAPATEVWTIREGFPISEELKSWGSRANWSVVWQMPRDVIAAATTTFSGDFPTALTDVVKTLAANGALIRARIFDGNRTVVVQGPGVPAQQ